MDEEKVLNCEEIKLLQSLLRKIDDFSTEMKKINLLGRKKAQNTEYCVTKINPDLEQPSKMPSVKTEGLKQE